MVMLDGDAGGSDGDAGGATNRMLNQLLIQITTVFCVFIIISINENWAIISCKMKIITVAADQIYIFLSSDCWV